MHEAATNNTVQEVLSALEELLTQETQALIRLDPEAVETAAKGKLALTQSLEAIAQSFTRKEQLQLAKVRTKLRNNLVLLAHAREHIQVTVREMTGHPPILASNQQPSSGLALLDVRG